MHSLMTHVRVDILEDITRLQEDAGEYSLFQVAKTSQHFTNINEINKLHSNTSIGMVL